MDNGTVVIRPVKNIRSVLLEKVNAGSNLTCVRQVLALEKFATGGNENPLKIWDYETGKVEFIAKSVSFIFLMVNAKKLIYFFMLYDKCIVFYLLYLKMDSTISSFYFFGLFISIFIISLSSY